MNIYNKKKSAPWHPDFRDESQLPSIKMVRVDFLMRLLLPFASATCLFLGAISYYSHSSAIAEIDAIEEEIAEAMVQDAKNLKENQLLLKNLRVLEDLKKFYANSLNVAQLLVGVSEHVTDQMIFESINFEPIDTPVDKKSNKDKKDLDYALTIKGMVEGSYGQAIELVNQYVEHLNKSTKLKKSLKEVEIISLERNPELNLFTYELKLVVS